MLYDDLSEAVAHIRSQCQLKPQIGIILGSGLGDFANSVEQVWSQEFSQIPHFIPTTVEGHRGRLIIGKLKDVPVVLLQGRIHHYEGHSMSDVVFPTRVMSMLGIKALLVTNAAGGLEKNMKPGDFMGIEDHINLMGDNPLKGKNMDQLGPRFPDMTEAYDRTFLKIALKLAKKMKIRMAHGVYVGVIGPVYETPAEIRFFQKIGGGAVGMSTVPEVIAANHFGVRVCGISCITNLAAGINKSRLSHKDVTSVAKMVETKFKDLLGALIEKIAESLNESP